MSDGLRITKLSSSIGARVEGIDPRNSRRTRWSSNTLTAGDRLSL
jgi:hypothetical protein